VEVDVGQILFMFCGDSAATRCRLGLPRALAAARRGLWPVGADGAGSQRSGANGGATVSGMQATIATYDPQTRSGSVLLDDGTPIEFGPEAFAASGLRLLRFGQRVRIDRDAQGAVTGLSLITM
jgi:2-phospho-L-lactate/phosphoenolpyruvate guanylyltransferase